MKRLLIQLVYAIIMTAIITGYSIIFNISISGDVVAVNGYKLLWMLCGIGVFALTRL